MGSEISALGVYTWYQSSALEKASHLGRPQLTPQQRENLARPAPFDEAFAIHFLEDVYAAGRVAGSWGDASLRKGTHDYYNENGLEVFTWGGGKTTLVLMGDAHMRPQDAFDICTNAEMPGRAVEPKDERLYSVALGQVIAATPAPGLTPGLGAMPRFRAEIGPFVGISSALDARVVQGGFEPSQTSNGFVGGVDVGFRLGMGLEGVLGEAGDGLVFAQIGYRATSPSTNKFSDFGKSQYTGNLTAAVPSESGVSLGLRMSFTWRHHWQ